MLIASTTASISYIVNVIQLQCTGPAAHRALRLLHGPAVYDPQAGAQPHGKQADAVGRQCLQQKGERQRL